MSESDYKKYKIKEDFLVPFLNQNNETLKLLINDYIKEQISETFRKNKF